MNPEALTEVWNWLLGLSKVQLIMLGGGIALLVAVSKFLRLLFLVGVLLLFLAVLLPQLLKGYEDSPLPAMVDDTIQRGVDAPQNTAPALPQARPQP